MEWTDNGLVLQMRPHGESAAIITVLTAENGLAKGLVRGGNSSRWRGILQIGNSVNCVWRARLADHLGHFTLELLSANSAQCLHDHAKLAALRSLCAMTAIALPENHPYPILYQALNTLLQHFTHPYWPRFYVEYEMHLLQQLGFALDLSCCAVTGANDNLVYVSPRTGRAVSRGGAVGYEDKLLPLPAFLTCESHVDTNDIHNGLQLTGYFLDRLVLQNTTSPAFMLRRAAIPSIIKAMSSVVPAHLAKAAANG